MKIITIGLILFLLCSTIASAGDSGYTMQIGNEKMPVIDIGDGTGHYYRFVYVGDQYQSFGLGNEYQCVL